VQETRDKVQETRRWMLNECNFQQTEFIPPAQ